MQTKQVVARVSELVQPLCRQQGVSLWDVTFEKEGQKYFLTVFIDREGGIFIEDCEKISRELDPLLDGREFDSLPAYTLSVSSAGLERRLVKPEHFAWAMGKKVEAGFYRARQGARNAVGVLAGYDGETLTLECGDKSESIPMAEVSAVHLVFEM